MSVLQNPKWEKFSRVIAQGEKSTGECYPEACGKETVTHGCYAHGSRLVKNGKVQERIAELQAKAAYAVVRDLAERMRYCRDVALASAGAVDESSPLVQSIEKNARGKVVKLRLCDKLKALELY